LKKKNHSFLLSRDVNNNCTCSSLLDAETVGIIFFGFKQFRQSIIMSINKSFL
jgi:hypothetical protein